MGQALYRTYRSKHLSEIVGQEHITQALSNSLKKGVFSHAYLFTGPRGTGKTSIARILAHEINELPYTDESVHLDIIEIDAASNRRIDEIRDLRDKVHIAPTSAKYKVYIIDEVHMLTREAFNALLKTLEEPPAHVIFILATTEVHKLPETIISRTQRFAFKPVEQDKVIAHLKAIAKKEKITIDEPALVAVAAYGEGSFRDSISLLDQTRSFGRAVTLADIEELLGIAPEAILTSILGSLQQHDPVSLVKTLNQAREQGVAASAIAKQLGEALRQSLLKTPVLEKDALIKLLEALLDVPTSSNPFVYLEIILLDVVVVDSPRPAVAVQTIASTQTPPAVTSQKVDPPKPAKPVAPEKAVAERPRTEPVVEVVAPVVEAPRADTMAGDKGFEPPVTSLEPGTLSTAQWPQILEAIKKHNTLFSIVRGAQPHFEGNKLVLEFGFAFHQKQVNQSKNKKILADAIEGLFGEQVEISCILGEKKPEAPALSADGEISHSVAGTGASEPPEDVAVGDYYVQQAEAEAASRPITAVSSIFGGGEVLES